MRVKATVVGRTLVLDGGVGLPQGARVELVVRAIRVDASTWDVSDEEWAALGAAMDEAEATDGVPLEVALAELRGGK